MSEFKIVTVKSLGMFVKVDDVLSLWEERNRLRAAASEVHEAVAAERAGCAQEVDDFADACAAEAEAPEELIAVLRAAAGLIRDRGEVEEDAAEAPAAVETPHTEGDGGA